MVLDAVTDSYSDRLYKRGGWTPVGAIPNYAQWPDGSLCATIYYHKDLRGAAQISVAQETPNQPEVIAFL